MSCKTETKYLTVKFIYSSRILNIQTGIIVCTSDKIKNLYNEITTKLLINHKDKDHKKFFHLFCNSKLCSNMMDKSFKDIFGIKPYVINIILRREFFDNNNLIKKPIKVSEDVKKKVYRKVHKSVNTGGVEEISSYEFIEELQKNDSINYKREINYKLFKVFFKLRLREDIILIDILKKFDKSKLSNGIDINSAFSDLIHLINLELKSKQIIKRPIILYYQSLFSVEQLKSVLSVKDSKLIESYLNGIEKFGINTNHPGCLAEQELRKIIISSDNFELFTKFIEDNNLGNILHPLSLYQKYIKLNNKKTDKKIFYKEPSSDYTRIISKPIVVQSGGGIEKLNDLKRILEIQGEPRHDFGSGDRAKDLPSAFDKSFFGKNTGEGPEFTRLKTKVIKDIGIDKETGLFLGNHETKYFLNFFKNIDYHLDTHIKDINSRFKFFRFKNKANLDMEIYNGDVAGISYDYKKSQDPIGIKYLKSILINDNTKHFLFDTSASISGTTCFKECLSGAFSKCERAGESEAEKRRNSRECNIEETPDITEIVPIVKFWDPASADKKKFYEKLKALKDAGDTKYFKMMCSLFMTNSAIDTEFLPEEGFDENDNSWNPRRESLSENYQVKINPDILSQLDSEETIDNHCLIIKLKNTEKDFLIEEGFPVTLLTSMIKYLSKESISRSNFEGILEREPDFLKIKEIALYLFDSIKERNLSRIDVYKILFDMKKSGDWSLIKWTQINNKYFPDNHKTTLYTGDVLCGLYSIVNDVSTLFGTTSIINSNPFYFTNNLGEIQFIENRTLAYYSGGDREFTYNDFLHKHDYISLALFEGSGQRYDDGMYEEAVDLTDPDLTWDETEIINIEKKLPGLISALRNNTDSLEYIFIGEDSIFSHLQQGLVEYEKMDAEQQKTDTERVESSINNLSIIINIFKKLETITRNNFFDNILEKTENIFNLMVDFTTTYSYIGIGEYHDERDKIFIPSEVQREIKTKLRYFTDETPLSSLDTEHSAKLLRKVSRSKPYDKFIYYREKINVNLSRILSNFGTEPIYEVCRNILEKKWDNVAEPTHKKIRMGHFVRDLSILLQTLMKVRSFLDVFDVFPDLITQINQDIQSINIDEDRNSKLREILNQLKIDIISKSLGSNEQANEILMYISMIKRIYECFDELFVDISQVDNGGEISRLTEISSEVQKDAFINVCESIDSLNSNLQLYFGYIDIIAPVAAES